MTILLAKVLVPVFCFFPFSSLTIFQAKTINMANYILYHASFMDFNIESCRAHGLCARVLGAPLVYWGKLLIVTISVALSTWK
jgi:hypothetical protein